MRWLRWGWLGVASVAAAAVLPGGAGAAERAVEVRDNAFAPAEVTVVVGTTVVWTSTGDNPHTVTGSGFDSHPDCPAAGSSACMQKGDRFQHTFPEPGTFSYLCRVHSVTMTGTVTVTAAATTTTSGGATTTTTRAGPTTTGRATTTTRRAIRPAPPATSAGGSLLVPGSTSTLPPPPEDGAPPGPEPSFASVTPPEPVAGPEESAPVRITEDEPAGPERPWALSALAGLLLVGVLLGGALTALRSGRA